MPAIAWRTEAMMAELQRESMLFARARGREIFSVDPADFARFRVTGSGFVRSDGHGRTGTQLSPSQGDVFLKRPAAFSRRRYKGSRPHITA
jgi:hypothetical protein